MTSLLNVITNTVGNVYSLSKTRTLHEFSQAVDVVKKDIIPWSINYPIQPIMLATTMILAGIAAGAAIEAWATTALGVTISAEMLALIAAAAGGIASGLGVIVTAVTDNDIVRTIAIVVTTVGINTMTAGLAYLYKYKILDFISRFETKENEGFKLSNQNIQHIKKHTVQQMRNQAQFISDAILEGKRDGHSFSNPNWTNSEMIANVEVAVELAMQKGTNGIFGILVDGETIIVI